MKFLKNLRKRGLAMFLALVMCLSLVQVTAFADETDPTPGAAASEDTLKPGPVSSKGEDGNDDGQVIISKTADRVEGNPGTWDITMTVKTDKDQIETKPLELVLALDTSVSMDWCTHIHTDACEVKTTSDLTGNLNGNKYYVRSTETSAACGDHTHLDGVDEHKGYGGNPDPNEQITWCRHKHTDSCNVHVNKSYMLDADCGHRHLDAATTNSVCTQRWQSAKDAMVELIEKLSQLDRDISIAVVGFNGKSAPIYPTDGEVTPLTAESCPTITDAVNAYYQLGNGTSPGAGLELANEKFSEDYANRVIILLSDGIPNEDMNNETKEYPYETQSKALKAAGVEIFTIGFTVEAEALSKIASDGKGHYLTANDVEGLSHAFEKISAQLKAMVQDNMGEHVKITGDATVATGNPGVEDPQQNVSITSDKLDLSWTAVGNSIEAGQTKTITYRVTMSDEAELTKAGSHPVTLNGDAFLNYSINGVDQDSLKFPTPTDTVEVAGLTTTYEVVDEYGDQVTVTLPESLKQGSESRVVNWDDGEYNSATFAATQYASGNTITVTDANGDDIVCYFVESELSKDLTWTDANDGVTTSTAGSHTLVHTFTTKKPTYDLTNIEKTLVETTAGLPEAIDTTGILFLGDENTYGGITVEDGTIKLSKDDKVTLLYAITVTGDVGGNYVVTDEGATRAGGADLTGTISESGEAVIYVTKEFTVDDIDDAKLVNIVTVKPGEGTTIPNPDPDPENPDDPDPDPKLTDDEETPAEKLYTITVKYVSDKDEELKFLDAGIDEATGETIYASEQTTAAFGNGTDYMAKVKENKWIYTGLVDVTGNHYTLDKDDPNGPDPVSVISGASVDGTINNEDVVIKVVYSLDNWDEEDPEEPDPDPDDPDKPTPGPDDPEKDNPGDDVPDKYQVKVVYTTDGKGKVAEFADSYVDSYVEIYSLYDKLTDSYLKSGNVGVLGTTAKANSGFDFYYWDVEAKNEAAKDHEAGNCTTCNNSDITAIYLEIMTMDEELESSTFHMQGGHVYTFTASFEEQTTPPVEPEDPERTFTLTYDANGGTGSMDPQSKTTTEDHVVFAVQANGFIAPEGMVFIGWKAESGDKVWKADELIRLDQDMTLYAQWTPVISTPQTFGVKYFINYHLQDDDGYGYHYDPQYDEVRTVTLNSAEDEVPVAISAADIKKIDGYSFNFAETLRHDQVDGTVRLPKSSTDIVTVTLYLFYTKDIEPQAGDLTVTKSSTQTTAKAGETVTWTITVKNNSSRVYENLFVSDTLTVTKMDATQDSIPLEISLGSYTRGTVTVENVKQRFDGWTPYGLERPEDVEEPENWDTADASGESMPQEPAGAETPSEGTIPGELTPDGNPTAPVSSDQETVPSEDIPEILPEQSEDPEAAGYVSVAGEFFDGPEDGDIWANLLEEIYAMAVDPDYFDLYPGEEVTFTVSYEVQPDDWILGNTVTVTGEPPVKAKDIPVNHGTYTVVHEYYTNDDLSGSTSETVTEAAGTVISAESIERVTVYGGNTYEYTSATGDGFTVQAGESSSGTVTLRYDRTTVPPTGAYTVVHEYYTDGVLSGSTRMPVSEAVGTVISAESITKVTTYGGNTYVYISATGDGFTVQAGESSSGTITLRYERTAAQIIPGPIPVTPPTNITPTPVPATPAPSTTITDNDVPLAAPGLNSVDHFDYIKGYPDGTVRPQANITRGEVATIFFRLMTNEFRTEHWSTENDFSDVKSGDWYNNAISTCVKAGILKGYPDGSFRPNQSITRAEFAAIAASFASEAVPTGGMFKDIEGHWAQESIERAAAMGWIKGSNGRFRPNDRITRAEVVTMINRMLDRIPDADHLLPDMKTFPDNTRDMWWYADMQEAANSHDYDRDEIGTVEVWTEMLPEQDWLAFEKEWATAADANVVDVARNLLGEGESSEGNINGDGE